MPATSRTRFRREAPRADGEWARTVSDGWEVVLPGGSVPALSRGQAADVVAALLWTHGASAVTLDRDGTVRGVFDRPLPLTGPWQSDAPIWARVRVADHMAAWHAASRPVRAGNVVVVPSHLAHVRPADDGLHQVVLDAGMAFGTGHHETTAGCLEALARVPVAGARVADVGTGSGILAIAAAKLGAARVVAVDVDPTAVEVAAHNCRVNGVEVVVAPGSTALLLDALADPSGSPKLAGPWDIVLANLLTGVVIDLARDLHDLTVPGGILVASGTSVGRAEAVAEALTRAGFVEMDVRPAVQWAVLVARRPAG